MSHLPLLLVGLDAACWEYLEPLLESDQMPALAGLMDRGLSGVLHSTMPALTPVAWSTLATGKNPGRHGVFEWNRLVAESTPRLQLHTSASRQGTPFWRRLNEAGYRVGLVNVPLTFPPQPVDGFVLCGYPINDPRRRFSYPAELLGRLEAELGPYRPGNLEAMLQNGQDWYQADVAAQEFQVEAAVRLVPELGIDVLVINLMLPDHANHLAPDMEGVYRAYRDSDRHLARLLDRLQPEQVMLISDHGSRRIQGRFHLNQWLYEQGLVTWQPRQPTDPAGDLNALLSRYARSLGLPQPVAKALRASARMLLAGRDYALPGWSRRPLERRVPAAYRRYAFADSIDWRQSAYLAFGALIYAHPHQTPDPAPGELRDRLMAVTDPQGERLFEAVYAGPDHYEGPFAEQSPDLILDNFSSPWGLSFAPGYRAAGCFVSTEGNRWVGEHSRDGIYVLAGSAIAGQGQGAASSLADIPATLLHILEVAVPEDYDGRVLTEALAQDRPVRYQSADPVVMPGEIESLSAEEEAAVTEQLRALGYVD